MAEDDEVDGVSGPIRLFAFTLGWHRNPKSGNQTSANLLVYGFSAKGALQISVLSSLTMRKIDRRIRTY